MTIDEIIVLIFSGLGIVFTYWYFLGKKEEEVEASRTVDIIVDGGYSPEVISIPLGKVTTLNFIRQDKNTCLEEIILSDFRVRKYLQLNQKVTIQIKPAYKGEYQYSCGMNMFHGKIVVK